MDSSVLSTLKGSGGDGVGGVGSEVGGGGAGGGGGDDARSKLMELARRVESLKSDKRRMAAEIEFGKLRLTRMTTAHNNLALKLKDLGHTHPAPVPMPQMPASSAAAAASSASAAAAMWGNEGGGETKTISSADSGASGATNIVDIDMDVSGEGTAEEDEEDIEAKQEMLALDEELALKEAMVLKMMASTEGTDMESVMRLYEQTTRKLEGDLRAVQVERDRLLTGQRIAAATTNSAAQRSAGMGSSGSASSASNASKARLKQVEGQLKALKGKLESQRKLLAVRERHEQTVKSLRSDITSMKQVKVALQKRMAGEAEKIRLERKESKKELARMQRDGQRKQYQMTKLETQNRKLQEMNKRKTEQAMQANKKLRDSQRNHISARGTASSRARAESAEGSDGAAGAAAGAGAGGDGGVDVDWVKSVVEGRMDLLRAKRSLRDRFAQREGVAKEMGELRTELAALPPSTGALGANDDNQRTRDAFEGRLVDLERDAKQHTLEAALLQKQIGDLGTMQRHFKKGSSGGSSTGWERIHTVGQAKKALNVLLDSAVEGCNQGEATVAETAKLKTEKRRLQKENKQQERVFQKQILRLRADHHEEVTFLLEQADLQVENQAQMQAHAAEKEQERGDAMAASTSSSVAPDSAAASGTGTAGEKDSLIEQLKAEKRSIAEQLNFFLGISGGAASSADRMSTGSVGSVGSVGSALSVVYDGTQVVTPMRSPFVTFDVNSSDVGKEKDGVEAVDGDNVNDDTREYVDGDETVVVDDATALDQTVVVVEDDDVEEEEVLGEVDYTEEEEEEEDLEEEEHSEVDDDSDYDPDEEKNAKRQREAEARRRSNERKRQSGEGGAAGNNVSSNSLTSGNGVEGTSGSGSGSGGGNGSGEHAWVDKLTVKQLKAELSNAGLKVGGLKADLKERLLDHLREASGSPPTVIVSLVSESNATSKTTTKATTKVSNADGIRTTSVSLVSSDGSSARAHRVDTATGRMETTDAVNEGRGGGSGNSGESSVDKGYPMYCAQEASKTKKTSATTKGKAAPKREVKHSDGGAFGTVVPYHLIRTYCLWNTGQGRTHGSKWLDQAGQQELKEEAAEAEKAWLAKKGGGSGGWHLREELQNTILHPKGQRATLARLLTPTDDAPTRTSGAKKQKKTAADDAPTSSSKTSSSGPSGGGEKQKKRSEDPERNKRNDKLIEWKRNKALKAAASGQVAPHARPSGTVIRRPVPRQVPHPMPRPVAPRVGAPPPKRVPLGVIKNNGTHPNQSSNGHQAAMKGKDARMLGGGKPRVKGVKGGVNQAARSVGGGVLQSANERERAALANRPGGSPGSKYVSGISPGGSKSYSERHAAQRSKPTSGGGASKVFIKHPRSVLQGNWTGGTSGVAGGAARSSNAENMP
jgi:hypothetical protein